MNIGKIKDLAKATIDKYGSVDAALTAQNDFVLAQSVLMLLQLIESADSILSDESLLLGNSNTSWVSQNMWKHAKADLGLAEEKPAFKFQFGPRVRCPKCNGENFMIERSPRSRTHCMDCNHSWENWRKV